VTNLHELAPGIRIWRAAHPEWHTTSELVACYALQVPDEGLLVVDPLLPQGAEQDEVCDELASLAGDGECAVYVTIPYHVRDAERVATMLGAPVVGHPALARRLHDRGLLVDATGDEPLPLGVRPQRIGSPVRQEMPPYVPGLRALAFGDCVVGVEGGLRAWEDLDESPTRRGWYEQRFLPTLRPLAALDVEHVLVTHGTPVVGGGAAALRELLDAPPIPRLAPVLDGDAVPAAFARS
jgi:hypothetical protein